MSGVRVVTDSACDLTVEVAAERGITVVPLTIRFGDEELLDRRDLSPDEFWRRCKGTATLPETAAPSPGSFHAAFEQARDEGADGVLCITLSSGVSATYQSALAGAEAMGEGFPISVVDSRTLTMGQGLLVLAASDAAAGGASLTELVAQVEDQIPRMRVYGALDTLEHLQKGGRVGSTSALIGSLLSIKPVLAVKDGIVAEESKQRTRGRSLDYLANKTKADAPLEWRARCDGAAPDLDAMLGRLAGVEVEHDLVVTTLGPVVGTHAGPGTVGVCYMLAAGPRGSDG